MQPSETNTPPDDRPGTPPRPPYSPVTPVLAHLAPASPGTTSIVPPASSPSPTSLLPSSFPPPQSGPLFAAEPQPVPISESENPDAIALRSAISILQLQKQQSLRDLQTLDRLKMAAAVDPERFAQELAAGKLSASTGSFIGFSDEREDTEDITLQNTTTSTPTLGKLPTPQNVVRMPPINWAKYQIVGDPLDKMHEEQRLRPSLGEPRRGDPSQRAEEYVLASPYRPLVDKLESPSKSKQVKRKKA
ncbi:hypothetical protein ASPZODRAFT_97854 [Penicilliopsis zonata CBS 506.65]|uniref:Uncharacterized protein n=1 Tax=Penicilliopsis zonata CBS 506.65 TaxID=1073090 RepID=A0A1L9SG25_9EURO|nr:hypothetical protein ASPZODRAFT_97854 [Penicilliopsis zonata CBS 506.65]OJJ46190.1 hypothetical protein ASPZODRAFT_97854 [Penicilliopsis zonata CBS 506.65]